MYAFNGIKYAIRNERNTRIHTVAVFYVTVFSMFFNFSAEKYAILFLTMAFVISSEMLNTSIEEAVDICAKDYNPKAKASKDVAAGAVLLSSIASVFVGVFLFCDASAYVRMWEFFCHRPLAIFLLGLSFVLCLIYVGSGMTPIINKLKSVIKFMNPKK